MRHSKLIDQDYDRKRGKQRLFVSFPHRITPGLTLFIIVCSHLLFSIAAEPIIAYPPKDQTVILSQPAAFGVIASPDATVLNYQWRKDGKPISGATNDQIVIRRSRFSDAGVYSVVVSSSQSGEASADAILMVNPPKAEDVDYSFSSGVSDEGGITCLPQSNGKILVAGSFRTVNGVPCRGIARLNEDGTTDHTFMKGFSGVDGTVNSVMVRGDGRILIGGCFTAVSGIRRNGIAQLNPDGSLDLTFQNGLSGIMPNYYVFSIVAQGDGKVLIGGSFPGVNGFSRTNIARLNKDGTLDTGFQSEISGPVLTITIQSDGKLIVGGDFTSVQGMSRNRIARLNSNGSLDLSFQNGLPGAGFDGQVSSVAVQHDGKILVGGFFYSSDGKKQRGMVRLNADGTLDNAFSSGFSLNPGNFVWSIALQSDDKVLVQGAFSAVDGVIRNGIARLNEDGTPDSGFQIFLINDFAAGEGRINSVTIQNNGKVLIGGSNPKGAGYLVRLNSDGTEDGSFSAFQNRFNPIDGHIYSLALQRDNKILIGGRFAAVYGVSRTNIARLNTDGTLDIDFQDNLSGAAFGGEVSDEGPSPGVYSLGVQEDGKVIIGGWFTAVNGVGRTNIARLNQDGTLDNSFQNQFSGANRYVKSVGLQSDGKILIAGDFTKVNGADHDYVARLNPDGSLDSLFQADAEDAIYSITVQRDNKILIGGNFGQVNGQGRHGIARLNTDGSLDEGFQNGGSGVASDAVNFSVQSTEVQPDGKVFIMGRFDTVNGLLRRGIARLSPDGDPDVSFPTALFDVGGYFKSFALQSDGKVLISGDFTTIDNVRRSIARLNQDGSLDTSFQPFLTSIFYGPGAEVSLTRLQTDGKIIICGSFMTVNNVPAAGIARLWGNSDIPPEIKTLKEHGADVNLSWYAISNRTYRVQYNNNLSTTNWTDLPGDVTATTSIATTTVSSLGPATHRFYRVILLP